MARFSYVAIAANGQRISGEMVADDRVAVCDVLNREGKFAVHVEPASERPVATSRLAPAASRVTVLTRELAMLLKAGLPLAQALSVIRKDSRGRGVVELVASLEGALDEGRSFHEATARHPRAFPPSYVSMVRVGEASGTLGNVMSRLADSREHEQRLRSKLVSALLYPSFLIVTAIGAVLLMLLFVVPRFKAMIVTARADSTEGARFAIQLSDWLIAHGAWLGVVVGILIAALVLAARNGAVRRLIDRAMLRVPIIGNLMRLRMTADLCRNVGTLLDAGVDLPQALALTRDMYVGRELGGIISASYESLRKGQDFTEPLTASGLLPPVATSMLRVGQETGNLAESALRMSEMFENKLDVGITRVLALLEPLIILLVSLFVAAIVMSIIGAIVSVNELVQ